MKKRFSIVDMTVKKKITLFSALMLIMLILVSAVGLWSSNMVNTARKSQYDNYAMPQYYVTQGFANFCNIKVRIRNILFYYNQDMDAIAKQEEMIESYKADAASYFALFEETMDNLTPEIQDQYRLVRSKIDSWYESSAEDINLVKEGKTEEAINELVTNSKFVFHFVSDKDRKSVV